MERQQGNLPWGLDMIDRRKNDDVKDALKEALHEWLDDKFAQFGRWSLLGIGAAALFAMAYLILKSQGWTPPH